MEQTVKCHICGKPYKFYAYSAADQSACPDCVAKAEQNNKGKCCYGGMKTNDVSSVTIRHRG